MQDTGKNIIIAGVGGQGILLFSNLLSKFYIKLGYELKISDVIGLGQRGGGVESHFRYSNKPILLPFIKAGDVDYLISFEQTEILRFLHCMKEDGTIAQRVLFQKFAGTGVPSIPVGHIAVQVSEDEDRKTQVREDDKKSGIVSVHGFISCKRMVFSAGGRPLFREAVKVAEICAKGCSKAA